MNVFRDRVLVKRLDERDMQAGDTCSLGGTRHGDQIRGRRLSDRPGDEILAWSKQ